MKGTMKRPTFTIYRDSKKEFRWRLQAKNGKITADSGEGYKELRKCQYAIDRVREEAASAILKYEDWSKEPPNVSLHKAIQPK